MMLGEVTLKTVVPHEVHIALTTLDSVGPVGRCTLQIDYHNLFYLIVWGVITWCSAMWHWRLLFLAKFTSHWLHRIWSVPWVAELCKLITVIFSIWLYEGLLHDTRDVMLKIVIPREVCVALTTPDSVGQMGDSGMTLEVILAVGLMSTSWHAACICQHFQVNGHSIMERRI